MNEATYRVMKHRYRFWLNPNDQKLISDHWIDRQSIEPDYQLIKNIGRSDIIYDESRNCLGEAIVSTDLNTVIYLIKILKPDQLNHQDDNGETALFLAGYHINEDSGGDRAIDIIMGLIRAGIDLNLQNCQGQSFLMKLIDHGFQKLYLGNFFPEYDPNEVDGIITSRVVDKILYQLIQAKANLNLQDNQGQTILICLVKRFNQHKKNINGHNHTDEEILFNIRSIAKQLIYAGADLSLENYQGESALSFDVDNQRILYGKLFDFLFLD